MIEELSDTHVQLKVAFSAIEPLELQEDGEVAESLTIPPGAASRIDFILTDNGWVAPDAVTFGWDLADTTPLTPSTFFDPLDEPRTQITGGWADQKGLLWELWHTSDDICIEAVKDDALKTITCLVEPDKRTKVELWANGEVNPTIDGRYISVFFTNMSVVEFHSAHSSL